MKKFTIRDHIQFDSETFHRSLIFSNDCTKALVLNFRPGQTLPSHNHPGYCLQLMVLKGEGVLIVDEKEVPVPEGDLFLLMEKNGHRFRMSVRKMQVCM